MNEVARALQRINNEIAREMNAYPGPLTGAAIKYFQEKALSLVPAHLKGKVRPVIGMANTPLAEGTAQLAIGWHTTEGGGQRDKGRN